MSDGVERWIKITLCGDGEPRAGKIVDGSLWLTRKEWMKHRHDNRIKIIKPKPKVINGEYEFVSEKIMKPGSGDGTETPPA